MTIGVRWPSAPGGTKGRVEIQRKSNAPNGVKGVVASVEVDPSAFRGGIEVRLAVPAGSAPSFDGAGLEIRYLIRALVDRRFNRHLPIQSDFTGLQIDALDEAYVKVVWGEEMKGKEDCVLLYPNKEDSKE